MSATTLEGMEANINEAMEFSRDDTRMFVPTSLLKDITSLETVKGVLEEHSSELALRSSTIPVLAEFFSQEAFKVFAILATNRCFPLMEHFYLVGFHDGMLPIQKRWPDGNRDWVIEPWEERDEHGKNAIKALFIVDKYHLDKFCCHWQWQFTPPTFVKETFYYGRFPDSLRLPFTRKGIRKKSPSYYSYVEENSVHVDHLPKDIEASLDVEGNPRVAIKELKRFGNNFESVADSEAAVLHRLRSLNSKHLIKAIAYYQKGDEHYLLFPWAEMGNLWEFWRNNAPKTDPDYICWAFTQLTGLAQGMERLHDTTSTPDKVNCRHGDLKPANILCFKAKNVPADNPRLVITDVGLAKVHNKETQLRDQTATVTGTARYAAPELEIEPKAPRSRRFDTWSMGCIFLEFAIWLLYGYEKLKEFSGDLDKPFYQVENSDGALKIPNGRLLDTRERSETSKVARIHRKVKDWVTYIEGDWRCSNDTAISELVTLIKTRLLVVKMNDPGSPVIDLDPADQASSTKPPVHRAPTWATDEQPAFQLPRNPDHRAYAPEILETMNDILNRLCCGEVKATGDRPSKEAKIPPGPPNTRSVGADERFQTPAATWVG